MTRTKITPAVRSAVRQIVGRSAVYDAETVRISRDGEVSARKDANKTSAGYDGRRYLVGRVETMVTPEGAIREGY